MCIPPLCVQYNRESLNSRYLLRERFQFEKKVTPLLFQPFLEPNQGIRFLKEEESYRFITRFAIIFSERIPNDSSIFQVFKNTDKIFNQLFSFRILILSL